jgi:hypothetical protein
VPLILLLDDDGAWRYAGLSTALDGSHRLSTTTGA